MKKLLLAVVLVMLAVPAQATSPTPSICDFHPNETFEGLAVLTVYKREGALADAVYTGIKYAKNVSIIRPDGLEVSARSEGEYDRASWAYFYIYRVSCGPTGNVVQDTIFNIASAERTAYVTYYVECFDQGRSIFTQGNTLPPLGDSKVSISGCLAQRGY